MNRHGVRTAPPSQLGGSEYWDSVATGWARNTPDALWRAHSDAVNGGLVARWLPEGALGHTLKTDVFDEACGEGVLRLLAGRSQLSVAMDLSPAAVSACRRRIPGSAGMVADARDLPFAQSTVDLALSLSTLDHLASHTEIRTSLRDLHRILKPGGRLIITLDNTGNPLVWLRNRLSYGVLNRFGIVPYYVGASVNGEGLSRLLHDSGFEVDASGAVLHCPRVLAIPLSRLVGRIGNAQAARWFLSVLGGFEVLALLPTRSLTGHFVAALARKPAAAEPTQSQSAGG